MTNNNLYSDQKKQAIYLFQQGRLIEAVQKLEALNKQQPDDPQCLHLLGETLAALGERGAAEKCFRKLVSLYPNISQSHYSLGTFLGMCNRLAEAYTHLNKASELNPLHLDASVKAGLVSMLAGKHKQAVTHFEQILANNPEHLEANIRMGDTLVELSEFDRAIPYYQKVLSINSLDTDALAGLATIHLIKMEVDKADQLIQPIVAQNIPKIKLVHSEIHEKQGELTRAIEILNATLNTSKLAGTDEASILFRLGKLYDKCNSYDLAFDSYQRANSLINTGYDSSSIEKEHAKCLNWNQSFIKSAPVVHPNKNFITPVFIVGMPRSGTSLTEQILASHPGIYGGGELHYIQETISLLTKNRSSENPFPACLLTASTEELEAIAENHLKKLEKLKARQDKNIQYVTDKMPNNFWHLGLIQILFPNAKVIHCVRNPLDTCLSCYFQNFSGAHPYSYSLESLGHYYNTYRNLMEHWKKFLNLNIFELNYESLVRNFEKTCKELISFCELPWDENCLYFYKSARTVTTSSYDQVRSPVHSTSVNRWQHYEKYIGALRKALNTNPA